MGGNAERRQLASPCKSLGCMPLGDTKSTGGAFPPSYQLMLIFLTLWCVLFDLEDNFERSYLIPGYDVGRVYLYNPGNVLKVSVSY